jgi:hypothetical protein
MIPRSKPGIACFLGGPSIRHVLLDRDVLDNRTINVPNRSGAHLLGIERAIFAAVHEFAVPKLSGENRVPHLHMKSNILLTGREKA